MSNFETKSEQSKPKRTLNPIIKAMNDYRNNVIGEHIGSKAPKRTAPIFKVTLAAARASLDMDESEKNSITVVDKASELFSANPDKFLKLAEKLEPTEPKKTKSSEKKTKGKSKKDDEEVVEESKVKNTKAKSKSKKKEEDLEVMEPKQTKAKGKSKKEDVEEVVESKQTKEKGKSKKVKEVVKQTIDSDSDSNSNSDSDSDSDSE